MKKALITLRKDLFFRKMEALGLALAYDDVRLKSGYSEVHPKDVSITTHFSRNIPLLCPLASAAMDTITEVPMAIAMPKIVGGVGILHKAWEAQRQQAALKQVKNHLNCLIEDPVCVNEGDTILQIRNMRQQQGYSFHSFPVLDGNGKLSGLLTRNDFDLSSGDSITAGEAMTPIKDLVTASIKTLPKEAYTLLREKRKKVLPLLRENGTLAGMYVLSDVKRLIIGGKTPYNVDKAGHLIVGAAIGTGEAELLRAQMLIEVGCDVLVIDTAHGDSKNVYETLRELKRSYPGCDVVVGNVSEGESAKRLAKAGADGIKVGQGPGSICTTRIVAGIGCPQVTAIYNCAKAVRGMGIPICADGGIRYSGDITIAIGAGADSVMLGKTLAGTTETPGLIQETSKGRIKSYRGMGSLAAMQASKASRERYLQGETSKEKLVPEGVSSVVLYQGDVADVLHKQIGGLRAGMGYVGAGSIKELQEKADFHRISGSGLAESHPHDIIITENPR